MSADLTSVAVYRRTVGASLERVWENVHDWEHLPWLHSGSFRSIELVERGDRGWKARIGLPGGGEILLELVVETAHRYVSRTLEGPGAGTEIWTRLEFAGTDRTDVEVEFLVPGVAPDAAERVGAGFTALYTRLWDEDEAMMKWRSAALARKAGTPALTTPETSRDLGDEKELRASLPLVTEFAGRRFRVVEVEGELVAHAAVCPHWLGPLDDAEVEGGEVTCPWHGYRFDVRSGRRCDTESAMRLAPAPRVVLEEGRVRLEAR